MHPGVRSRWPRSADTRRRRTYGLIYVSTDTRDTSLVGPAVDGKASVLPRVIPVVSCQVTCGTYSCTVRVRVQYCTRCHIAHARAGTNSAERVPHTLTQHPINQQRKELPEQEARGECSSPNAYFDLCPCQTIRGIASHTRKALH
eukprot:3944594-Prymnesium_polylepis.1